MRVIDENNASCAIKMTGRAFVNDANDTYSGVFIPRWSRSRMVRCTVWTPTTITIQAQCCPSSSYFTVAVVVNGALFTTLTVPTTGLVNTVTVSGMVTGAKTIDFIEDFQERGSPLNSSVDGPSKGVYVIGVEIPTPPSTNAATAAMVRAPSAIAAVAAPPATLGIVARATATTGTVIMGDSHVDGLATTPVSWYGWAGQLRAAAHVAGQLVTYGGGGSSTLCGDGPTAEQSAQMVRDGWTAMGCTTKRLLILRRSNDYAYAGTIGTTQTSDTDYTTYLGAMLDSLDASDHGYTCSIFYIPQGTNQTVANGIAITRATYITATSTMAGTRAWVTIRDITPAGLVLGTDYVEAGPNQVHLNQLGHDKVAPVAKGWYGL